MKVADLIETDCFTISEIIFLGKLLERIGESEIEKSDRHSLINTLLINYASSRVLSEIGDLYKATGLAESLYETFRSYYMQFMKGNAETILPETPFGMDDQFIVDCVPIPSAVVREKIDSLLVYFCNVRKQLTNDVLNVMGKIADEIITKTCDALSKLHAEMSNGMMISYNEAKVNEMVKKVSDEFRLPNLMSDFQIIILYFDVFPFNYNKFKEVFTYKVNDPAISSVDVQRRYLISLLKKDSQFDRKRNFINSLCSNYETVIEKVKSEVDADNERIRDLYEGSTSELMAYTDQILKSCD